MTKKQLMEAITIVGRNIIIKGIDLSKNSVYIHSDIGGNLVTKNVGGHNKQGHIGGTNDQKNIGGNNCQKDIGGYNDQGNIAEYNDQGNIGERNTQLNIGGSNNQCNIGRHNWQYTINGDNRQDDIKGDNRQGRIHRDNSQGHIGGYNNQDNIGGDNTQGTIGGLSRNNLHYVHKKRGIRTVDIDYTDGIYMYNTITKKMKNVEYITGMCGTILPRMTYLVKTAALSYHSTESMSAAKTGYRKKRDTILYKLGGWVRSLKDDSIITKEIFNKETGSCMPGINHWVKQVGWQDEEITWKALRELFEEHPTYETKQVMLAWKEIQNND